MNILSNAVKYNKENGYVYISCREIPSKQTAMTTLEFVCRDTGIGMTEAFQKRIFEPFAQEHAGSRTKFAGTGLGMSIAKTIPIIAMTANAFTEDRLKAKKAGMNEHIVKPVDVELLIKVIHKLVEYN